MSTLKFEENNEAIESIKNTNILNEDISLGVSLKTYQQKGNLVYEYNPFRNYRLNEDKYLYKNKIFSPKELCIELGQITEDSSYDDDYCKIQIIEKSNSWKDLGVPEYENDPIPLNAGQLTDFETDELNFDINHPVDILPLYSYDNSVNLILNDGVNPPRLINSRFSPIGKNLYLIVDRKGNNDTNIYDQGSLFDIDTSLYKRSIEIPKLRFVGVLQGGQLPVGNYHFYFKYVDADENETDFIAESGLVSVFIGNVPSSIKSGFRDENSHKQVHFILNNVDSSYLYVNVYYTRSSGDIYENANVKAVKINQKFSVNNSLNCNILITGYENTTEIPLSDINPMYLIVDSAKTLETCLNMLFLGNILKPLIPYRDLEDLSLRFLPYICNETYPLQMDKNYNITSKSKGYYDPKFIYDKVGYWNHEIYRLGIVYILSNNQLSPVFNIRGIENLSDDVNIYSDIPLWSDSKKSTRNFIIIEENTYKIITNKESYSKLNDEITSSQRSLENSKGVISLNGPVNNDQLIYSIGIQIKSEVISYIKDKLKIKGFFFVRLKRIPTILCQAFTIGIDSESKTPVIPIGTKSDLKYISERFLNDDKILTNNFENRIYTFNKNDNVRIEGAICPDYDIDSPFFNSLFNGDLFSVYESDIQPDNYFKLDSYRNYEISGNIVNSENTNYEVNIIGVEDNTKLVAIDDHIFSARAGEAEEAFRYEYLEREYKNTDSTNLVRGSFGPYLGIKGTLPVGKFIDIKIPGYNSYTEQDLFKIRYDDKSSFYAISERISLKDISDWFNGSIIKKLKQPLFRGDCYICQFTHRLNRNFLDPSAPTNDKIVDPNCWNDNYEVTDEIVDIEKFEKINLGDVNAVKLGMWITLQNIRSTKNLNIRALDDSIPDEQAYTGHSRGFFPYYPLTADGAYKTPEALCYNKAFEKSTSERYNYETPDVPAIKNDFTNRILYSDININDAFKNGFRVFLGTHYRDYPKTYGSLTKIVELRGNLICVFEHGIGLISVNERAIAGEGSGGTVYINTSNVLPENPKIISDTFGSLWKDSIIKTPKGIYGVDTVGKKIWRTNGSEFECISDFRIQEFLNNNISLGEREIEPIIGVRNVKTHYNKFKGDVMFTFYDNLYGFEEKVWNVCYNETLLKWITFYSWVPSYSENIYNLYFSFDRNTSKWITKLGISKKGNKFSDGIVLTNNIIPNDAKEGYKIGELDLVNRTLPTGNNINVIITYEMPENDNFRIENNSLYLKTDAVNLCTELFVRGVKSGNSYIEKINDPKNLKLEWINNCVLNSKYTICKDDQGRRKNLEVEPNDKRINGSSPVILLNIKANIKVEYSGTENTLEEAYITGFVNKTKVNAGYYQSTVAVTTKYNMLFLTTDFWKHGQAGIIDESDEIYPTYWYGKLHPFEFEFVVADNPTLHKIFDNLEIISNNAEPESFHYEIVGDCYDFAKDKKNMYIRQEATKHLYQINKFDVTYDRYYLNLNSEHRPLLNDNKEPIKDLYDKSTIFPLYYSRRDSINEIEDFYHLKDNISTKDFSSLAGAEIVRYPDLNEYRIWNHAKAVNLLNSNRLRGNMLYKEDKWNVQINPLNIIEKNETDWLDLDGNITTKIPVELEQSPIPNEILNGNKLEIPNEFIEERRGYTLWENSQLKSVKLKDKFMKVRIRYSGKNLAIISAIKTMYSVSYS